MISGNVLMVGIPLLVPYRECHMLSMVLCFLNFYQAYKYLDLYRHK